MRFRVIVYPPSDLPRTDPKCPRFELGTLDADSREAAVEQLEGITPDTPSGDDFIPGEYDYEIIPVTEPVIRVLETVAA